MTGPLDIAAVNGLLSERMMDLARTLGGAEPTTHRRDEWRLRNRGSLSVMVAGPKRGAWYDNEAGCGGDPLGLVAHLRHVSMRDAYAWALGWLGEAPHHRHTLEAARPVAPPTAPHGHASERDTRRDDGKAWSIAKGAELWREAMSAEGTPAEQYLTARGLELPTDAPLRFHPSAWRNRDYGPLGPAMVALMTDPATGQPCGAHVTYLRGDGGGKAAGERVKVMLGIAGTIRLVPDEEVSLGLGLAEGIETALAVTQCTGWKPVWAATSAGAIRNFPVLPGIEALTVFADTDAKGTGTDAARECCRRWAAAGRNARLLAPPTGDWDDALPRTGRAA
jgi:hypothetical protein